MRGPALVARSMSLGSERGRDGRAWQYHSRSDRHSKVACWALLFDLLLECDAVRDAANRGRVGFGINHVMVGAINKALDLVLTIVPPTRIERPRRNFASMASTLGVVLDAGDMAALAALPPLYEDTRTDVSEVAVALEAKACMTEHVKSLPRLHAEILATGYLAKKAAPRCITVSYTLVNAAPTFVTPSAADKVNHHRQPEDALRAICMIARAVPTASESRDYGYDAVGVTVIDCRNDGSPVLLLDKSPAPSTSEHVRYERMLRTLCAEFRSRFRL
jgi:hypothetical protein